jgi:anti-anti-sigma factor
VGAEFQIKTEETDAGTAITLVGELDAASAESVMTAFGRAREAGRASVLLDMTALSFIDSAGLRSIILIQQQADQHDVVLSVLPPPAHLLELLDVTGLTERLALAPELSQRMQRERFLERVELELPRDPGAPRAAREELRRALELEMAELELSTALLLTSELVTNAVLHPDPSRQEPISVRITSYPQRLRVEITDRGPGFDPDNRPSRPPELGGRGLLVVDRLASRWGTAHITVEGEPRFAVWYEMDTCVAKSRELADAGVG